MPADNSRLGFGVNRGYPVNATEVGTVANVIPSATLLRSKIG